MKHGDEWVVNGQKMWTTGAHDADYIWLACRTDPECRQAQGHSILIVDTTDPGYSWTPIILSDGAHHTNASYYNDVRVPADMLVGAENGGWKLITTQLNHERVGFARPGGWPASMTEGARLGLHARRRRGHPDRARRGQTPSGADQVDLADQRTAELAGRRLR